MTRTEQNFKESIIINPEVKQSKYNYGKFNKTSFFILPIFGIKVSDDNHKRWLVNCFIDDYSIEHDLQSCIFMLLSCSNYSVEFKQYCKQLESLDSYIMDYFVGVSETSTNLNMYVFKIPNEWLKDYHLFLEGKYSQMSDKYKSLINRYVIIDGKKLETKQWGILNKSESLKDAITKEFINPNSSTPEEVISFRRSLDFQDEIWDKPQLKEEVFNYDNRTKNRWLSKTFI